MAVAERVGRALVADVTKYQTAMDAAVDSGVRFGQCSSGGDYIGYWLGYRGMIILDVQ